MGVRLSFVGLLFALALFGCAGRDANKNVVTGQVTYKDKAISTGTVLFYDQGKNIVASGAITKGEYRVEKVPEGPMSIAVKVPPPPTRAPGVEAPPPSVLAGPQPDSIDLPAKFASPEKSGLTYTVTAGEQTYNIEMK